MAMSKSQVAIGVVSIVLSGMCFAEEVTRDGAMELMAECQRQRQINIAPYKAQEIEKCITNQRRDREACEAYNKNFGEINPRMFWELPVCEQAFAAENHFRMNPRSQAFSLP